MSTSEKWTTIYVCPCGKGKIIEKVDSPDNAFSRTTYEYNIECPDCSKNWEASNRTLSNRDRSVVIKSVDISSLNKAQDV